MHTNAPVAANAFLRIRSAGAGAFAPCFLAWFALLYAAVDVSRDTAAMRAWIEMCTLAPGAALLNAVYGDGAVVARGLSLVGDAATLRVVHGCDGVEMLLLVAAACLAAPLSWRARLAGLALGALLMQSANILRIAGLFIALRSDPQAFAVGHGVIAPAASVALGAAFFVLWLRASSPSVR